MFSSFVLIPLVMFVLFDLDLFYFHFHIPFRFKHGGWRF